MMNPPLGFQLCNNSINERESGLCVFPCVHEENIFIPFNLFTYDISMYLVEVFYRVSVVVEKFPPQ